MYSPAAGGDEIIRAVLTADALRFDALSIGVKSKKHNTNRHNGGQAKATRRQSVADF
jgi:hypothetical protein